MAHPGGRPPHFKTPEQLEVAWQTYLDKCILSGDWITKEHFCSTNGYYTDLFNTYNKKPEFSGVLRKVDQDCKYHLLNRGLKNEHQASIVKLIASCNYGMSEKSIQENQGQMTVVIQKEDKDL